MKILYAVLLLMICAGNVFGQNRDNIWELGTAPHAHGIDFSLEIADTFSLVRKMNFFGTNAVFVIAVVNHQAIIANKWLRAWPKIRAERFGFS
jgi:hypothetical protein